MLEMGMVIQRIVEHGPLVSMQAYSLQLLSIGMYAGDIAVLGEDVASLKASKLK